MTPRRKRRVRHAAIVAGNCPAVASIDADGIAGRNVRAAARRRHIDVAGDRGAGHRKRRGRRSASRNGNSLRIRAAHRAVRRKARELDAVVPGGESRKRHARVDSNGLALTPIDRDRVTIGIEVGTSRGRRRIQVAGRRRCGSQGERSDEPRTLLRPVIPGPLRIRRPGARGDVIRCVRLEVTIGPLQKPGEALRPVQAGELSQGCGVDDRARIHPNRSGMRTRGGRCGSARRGVGP